MAVSGPGCVIGAVSDGAQGAMEEFASAHVSCSHEVRRAGHEASLAQVCGWNVAIRKDSDDGAEAIPPAPHLVASNPEAMLSATRHGAGTKRPRECRDQSGRRFARTA